MKKPDYLGEREFLTAIQLLDEQLKQSASLETAIPFITDGSYQNTEIGAVGVHCVVKAAATSTPDALLYRFAVQVKIRDVNLESLVKVGARNDIEMALQNLMNPDAAHTFLLDIYRDISELPNR